MPQLPAVFLVVLRTLDRRDLWQAAEPDCTVSPRFAGAVGAKASDTEMATGLAASIAAGVDWTSEARKSAGIPN